MGYPSVTYTFVNGAANIIDAGEINTNFQDLIDGVSDGTFDINVAGLTCTSVTGPFYINATAPFVGTSTALAAVHTTSGAAGLANIHAGFQSLLHAADAGNISGTKYGSYASFKRTIDAVRTDTAPMCSLYSRFEIATAGNNYTNNGGLITGLYHLGLVKSGAGSITADNVYEVYLGANTTAVTGRKTTLFVGVQTNGSVGNCSITDNLSWTGAWFLNSTATDPSLLSGSLWLPNLKSGANQVAAGASAGELWVDTSAANVVKLGA